MNNNETAISDEEAYLILKNIDENIGDIKSDVIDIRDNIEETEIANEKEEKKEEEKKEEKQEISEIKSGEAEAEEESSVTLETLSAQIDDTNSLLQDNNNLQTIGIFTQGIIIGVNGEAGSNAITIPASATVTSIFIIVSPIYKPP